MTRDERRRVIATLVKARRTSAYLAGVEHREKRARMTYEERAEIEATARRLASEATSREYVARSSYTVV